MKVLFCLCLFLSQPVFAASSEQARSILVLSGTQARLKKVPLAIKESIRSRASYYPAGVAVQLEKALLRGFSPKRLQGSLQKNLQSGLTHQEASGLLNWYKSDLGKKISKANLYAETSEGRKALQKFLESAQKTPPTQSRIDKAKKVITLLNSDQLSLNQSLIVTRSILVGLNGFLSKEKKQSSAQINQQMDQIREVLKPQIEQGTLLMTVFAYRNLSPMEYQGYLRFLSSPTGKKGNQVLSQGLMRAIRDASSRVAASLRKSSAGPQRKRTK